MHRKSCASYCCDVLNYIKKLLYHQHSRILRILIQLALSLSSSGNYLKISLVRKVILCVDDCKNCWLSGPHPLNKIHCYVFTFLKRLDMSSFIAYKVKTNMYLVSLYCPHYLMCHCSNLHNDNYNNNCLFVILLYTSVLLSTKNCSALYNGDF